jgi:hypothetical protein
MIPAGTATCKKKMPVLFGFSAFRYEPTQRPTRNSRSTPASSRLVPAMGHLPSRCDSCMTRRRVSHGLASVASACRRFATGTPVAKKDACPFRFLFVALFVPVLFVFSFLSSLRTPEQRHSERLAGPRSERRSPPGTGSPRQTRRRHEQNGASQRADPGRSVPLVFLQHPVP